MASFQKRGNTWQYTVSAKPKPIRKGGFRTKKEAQVAAAEVEADLQKGILPHLKMEPIDEYFEKWLKVYKTDISQITLRRYKNTLQTLKDHFEGKPIQSISKRDYQQFLNEYAKTHAKESTRKLNVHIRSCIKDAIDEGILRTDFTRGAIVTGNVEAKRPEEKHLNYDESQKLINELYNRLDRSLGYYLLLLGITSGMRFAEMVGLTRKDFNFKTNEITINKTWDYKTGTGFTKTKNDPSNRIIKMDDDTMNAFKDLFKKLPSNIHGLVFFSPGNNKNVLTNENVNKILKRTLTDLKINPISVHGLRHTHASILLYRKISIYYVSERLGHASIDTTQRHYAHVIKELREEDTNNTITIFKNIRAC
ncbi:site-specific integrase [Bacillus sp. FJAT-49732]|uniref:Site-specific integrase n=1 Tax=Lederbergia citrisecunda TaxID=2833583 RepID=A0A942YKE8_9BACI|nr:site-specific integrase [Lederbergia citrisecunda]MBS4200313.1 site-specific integrase [Lederbergia citrisecunda]